MSELITDEIVEAAARERYLNVNDGDAPHWDDLSDGARELERMDMRDLLEAAAPLIAARALEEAADDWRSGLWAAAPRRADRVQERIANGQFVQDWLRQRAAREKEGRG